MKYLVMFLLLTATPAFADDCNDESMVITMAQKFVRDSLRSPSTAKFPRAFDEYQWTKIGDNHHMLFGHVDAQNAFGATIRNTFAVEMTCDGETWRRIDMVIQ